MKVSSFIDTYFHTIAAIGSYLMISPLLRAAHILHMYIAPLYTNSYYCINDKVV